MKAKENSRKKLIATVLCIVFIPLLTLVSYTALLKNAYMDPEYPMFKLQKDYISQKHDDELIILGDSRAKSGILADRFSCKAYNLSLGGTSPIEMYFSLSKYLESGNKPKKAILAFAPQHYYRNDCFWERTVYFHYLSLSEISQVLHEAKEYKNYQIYTENCNGNALQYLLYMPAKYGTALINSGFAGRYNTNIEIYEYVNADLGYKEYGKAEYSDEINFEASEKTFFYDRLTDSYLRKIIDLCQDNNIELIIEQIPMNESSYNVISASYKKNYEDYMKSLSIDYPNIIIQPYITYLPNRYFGDSSHLNRLGAEVYTDYLANKY